MTEKLILAGGCFWCVESDLKKIDGVMTVTSGYTGGDKNHATYEDVCSHNTTHREAVEVVYDSSKTSAKQIIQFFLDHIDPTDGGGQFADRGHQYEPVIYYKDDAEKQIAHEALQELEASGIYEKPIAVKLEEVKPFFEAEEYHQNYSEKNKGHYMLYRKGSGREDQVARVCQIRLEKGVDWKEVK
ncbi:MAG: peptide-methionine (S)-S-oxide reductase MsrA [Alphaproteobacteria bacterium]|nr:peptide-methionine (S)-S-oxide reductase MsrA [Alphaproteobacteria bacterium]